MTTAIRNFTYRCDTIANIKTWIDNVQALVLATGLTQASDTGQLDTSTGFAPAIAGSTTYGYHIFQFTGPMTGSFPLKIKLTYSNTSSSLPRVNAVVAAASDGAGTMLAPSFTCGTATSYTMGTPAPSNSYACYVDQSFSMVLGYRVSNSLANNCILNLYVERSRNPDGSNYAGGGFMAEGATAQMSSGSVTAMNIFAGTPGNSSVPCLIPTNWDIGTAEGTNVNVFRHYAMTPGVHPLAGILTYYQPEFSPLVPFTCTVLGGQKTYLPMGEAMNYFSYNYKASHSAAIRWE